MLCDRRYDEEGTGRGYCFLSEYFYKKCLLKAGIYIFGTIKS
jgi:hypothetical protein